MSFKSVELFRENDLWVVVITENAEELRRSFQIEQHAHSYADGQRIRLGLPPVGPLLYRSVNDEGGALSG